MRAVCIIPARGNSRRIPRKNIKRFHHGPIIGYSIGAARLSGVFAEIVVSTDDSEIRDVAMRYGAGWIERPAHLAGDEPGTQEVMAHALASLPRFKYACCLYPCAPMLSPYTLKAAYEILVASDLDYLVPVATWLRDPGQFYMGRADAFRLGRPLIGHRTGLFKIPASTECDINTMEDWTKAEQMYANLMEAT